jgi:hypothetical protein
MRIRALLFIPALAAAALAIGVSSASAATLFTTAAHTTRVSVGATLSATVLPTLDLTAGGVVQNSCTAGNFDIIVGGNNDASGVDLRVVSGSIGPCDSRAVTPTFPWTVTITGNGSPNGTNTTWNATVHNSAFHVAGFGLFTGTLSTGVMALQPTVGASPVTLNLANAGPARNHVLGLDGFIDGNIRVNGAFSLTN